MRVETQEEIISKARAAMEMYGDEFMVEMINVYLADAPKHLVDLRAAHRSGNEELFTRAAHTLKSSSSYVGATGFADLAKDLEVASRQGGMAELADQVTRLEEEYLQVKAALEAVRGS